MAESDRNSKVGHSSTFSGNAAAELVQFLSTPVEYGDQIVGEARSDNLPRQPPTALISNHLRVSDIIKSEVEIKDTPMAAADPTQTHVSINISCRFDLSAHLFFYIRFLSLEVLRA